MCDTFIPCPARVLNRATITAATQTGWVQERNEDCFGAISLPSLFVTGQRSSLHRANSLALVLRDGALRFSRTTSALAVEGIAKPFVCG